MYGLNSRESLSKRQSRWERVISDDVNTYSLKSVKDSPIKENNIIKTINREEELTPCLICSPSDNTELLEKLKNLTTLLEKYSLNLNSLREENNLLHNKLAQEINKIAQETIKNTSLLEKLTVSTNQISEVVPKTTFVPFYNNPDFVSTNNMTKLDGSQVDMSLDILGFNSDSLVIYPFGSESNLPSFEEELLEMSFIDSEGINGIISGVLKRDLLNKIYTIDISSSIGNYSLPVNIRCCKILNRGK